MINGLHAMIYSNDAEADRAFLRDVLKFPHVDAGHGWLIFAAPPAEIGFHPAEGDGKDQPDRHEVSLMCDDIHNAVADLKAKGVQFASDPKDQGWGILSVLKLPGGGTLGLYQPRHPRAAKPA